MKNTSGEFVGLATGGYIGFIPFAPGTFGSLLGIPLFYFISAIPLPASFSFVVGFIIFSIWVAGKAEASLNAKDPGCIDEHVEGFHKPLPFLLRSARKFSLPRNPVQ